jgi:hypothetical protein
MGWALQAAEKLDSDPRYPQGTTSVVPQMQQNKRRALAPEVCLSGMSLENRPFSAACLATEGSPFYKFVPCAGIGK